MTEHDPSKILFEAGYIAAISDAIDDIERITEDDNVLILKSDVIVILRALRRNHGA